MSVVVSKVGSSSGFCKKKKGGRETQHTHTAHTIDADLFRCACNTAAVYVGRLFFCFLRPFLRLVQSSLAVRPLFVGRARLLCVRVAGTYYHCCLSVRVRGGNGVSRVFNGLPAAPTSRYPSLRRGRHQTHPPPHPAEPRPPSSTPCVPRATMAQRKEGYDLQVKLLTIGNSGAYTPFGCSVCARARPPHTRPTHPTLSP